MHDIGDLRIMANLIGVKGEIATQTFFPTIERDFNIIISIPVRYGDSLYFHSRNFRCLEKVEGAVEDQHITLKAEFSIQLSCSGQSCYLFTSSVNCTTNLILLHTIILL